MEAQARVPAWVTRMLWASNNKTPPQTHLHHYHAIAGNSKSKGGKVPGRYRLGQQPHFPRLCLSPGGMFFPRTSFSHCEKKWLPAYSHLVEKRPFHSCRKRALPFTLPGTVLAHVDMSLPPGECRAWLPWAGLRHSQAQDDSLWLPWSLGGEGGGHFL